MNNRCLQVSTPKLAKHGQSITEQKLLQIAPKTDNFAESATKHVEFGKFVESTKN